MVLTLSEVLLILATVLKNTVVKEVMYEVQGKTTRNNSYRLPEGKLQLKKKKKQEKIILCYEQGEALR